MELSQRYAVELINACPLEKVMHLTRSFSSLLFSICFLCSLEHEGVSPRSPGSGASSPSSYKWVILVRSETQSPHQQNGCNARTYTIHWLSELNKMIHNEPCISGKFCACLSLGIAFRKCRVIWASQSQEMGQSTW